jgi:ABC-type branched-subunit amino acid transport system ATPase component
MAQAAKLADRMYVLEEGRLVAEGTPQELKNQPGGLAAKFFEASRIA